MGQYRQLLEMKIATSSRFCQVGGLALGASRGAHPTMRLDSFLKSTDPGYQHAEVWELGLVLVFSRLRK